MTKSYYTKLTKYLGTINGKPKYKLIYLHRIVMNVDKDIIIDHINHNTLNNRKINLRIIENNKNLKHRKSRNSNNTTGYRNVSWIKNEKIYRVQLQINGKNTKLGDFTDVDEAGKFAEKMREKYYGKYKGEN